MQSPSTDIDHPAFITVYKSIGGWKAVLMTWNEELSFYEPYQTSASGGFAKKEQAILDAKEWAADEELEYKEN